jgi:hypothetical protein
MSHRSPLIALLVVLLAAAPAAADRKLFGSTLAAPATESETHGADTAFWAPGEPAPDDGQILEVRLKGTAVRQGGVDPLNEVHFQSLRPLGDGSVVVQASSAPFYVPVGGDPEQISIYHPENLCVRQGDLVDFNDEGGFAPPAYPEGVPFRVFGAVDGAATAQYTADNGTNNGTTLHPTVVRGEQLLMQLVLGTGEDASEPCGGPRRHPDGSLVQPQAKLHVVTPQRAYVSSDRSVEPTLYCNSADPCAGVAKLVKHGRKIAAARFSIDGGSGDHVPMRLSRSGWRALRRRPGDAMRVKLVAKAGERGPYVGVITIRH